MRAVYERVRRERPGMLDRPDPWWDVRLYDPESQRHGAQPLQAVLVPDGYALYAVRSDRDEDGPAGEVTIRELVAATPAARALLWAFLLDQDLTRTVTWTLAPPDEPLWLMLTDPDAVRVGLESALWVRIVDVPAALTARALRARSRRRARASQTRSAPGTPGAGGWPAAAASPPTRAADLALDAAALGAAYLGATALTRAGGGRPRRRAAPGRAGPRVGRLPRRRRAVVPGDLLSGRPRRRLRRCAAQTAASRGGSARAPAGPLPVRRLSADLARPLEVKHAPEERGSRPPRPAPLPLGAAVNAAKRHKRRAERPAYNPGADSRPPSPVTVPMRAAPG